MRVCLYFLVLALQVSTAHSQDAFVVSACGALPQPYSVGSSRLPTVDVNGKLCLSINGLGTGNVIGPNSSTVNDIPVFGNTIGTSLSDLGSGGLRLLTPSGGLFVSGVTTELPGVVTSGGGDTVIGATNTYVPGGHGFFACVQCTISAAAAGSTVFSGTDGSTASIIGHPGGAGGTGGFHMSVLGPSVDARADNAVCIGHGAACYGSSDVIISGSNTGTAGSNFLVNSTSTASNGSHVALAGATITGTSNTNIAINPGSGCTYASISRTVGIGRGACPSVDDDVVIGGSLAKEFYFGDKTTQGRGRFGNVISVGDVQAATYHTGATAGVDCTGVTAGTVTVAKGIVTHC